MDLEPTFRHDPRMILHHLSGETLNHIETSTAHALDKVQVLAAKANDKDQQLLSIGLRPHHAGPKDIFVF